MLNELVIIERGARNAGISTVLRHPDVKDVGRIPTLSVQLDDKGRVAFVTPVPSGVRPWTLRKGQHNSFPFVQFKEREPLWLIPRSSENDEARSSVLDKKNDQRRDALQNLAGIASFNGDAFAGWPGTSLLASLQERRLQLAGLQGTKFDVTLAAVDNFLVACGQNKGNGSQELLQQVIERVLEELKAASQDEWIEVAASLLIGCLDNKTDKWRCSGALLFDAYGKDLRIYDPKLISAVSEVMVRSSSEGSQTAGPQTGICAISGSKELLLTGNFPQPNVPALGQTYLFSKNRNIPANDRYSRYSADAIPVSQDAAIRLAAVFEALTSKDRENITWRKLPSEKPKQSDLLLAFVEDAPDVSMTESLVEEDFSKEIVNESFNALDSVATFEKRTERLIEQVKGVVGTDTTKTPVRLTVFRKVDRGNSKVICSSTPSVDELHRAALEWVAGERNVPDWIELKVLKKGHIKPVLTRSPHVAPLGLIAFSKHLYVRDGTDKQEVVGLPAAEALSLFLDMHIGTRRLAGRVLRVVLKRRGVLVAGVACVQHAPSSWERRSQLMRKFDRYEALRTITLLGVLLHKLSRTREDYMNEAAFKLGQLLAAADVVHAGYCADVRGGAVPPSLLGNQVFTMAQTDPVRALATLCRRWKPYDGWAKKAVRERNRVESLLASNEKHEQQRGWDIKKALRYAREVGSIAAELAPTLTACRVDDAFRAELLLGYIAGLPKAQNQRIDAEDQDQEREE